MFSGEDEVRIRATEPWKTVRFRVRDALERLGDVDVYQSGEIEIRRHRFSAPLAKITLEGWVEASREPGAYDISLSYRILPEPVAWVLGLLIWPFGLAILLLLPWQTKSQIDAAIRRALDAVRDSF